MKLEENSISDHFYEQLTGFAGFDQFTELDQYSVLPDDWSVVITDIRGSTQAISQGRYKEVNSVSTASVAAVLNVFRPLRIPYVFGGDGATLCIPSTKLDEVKGALAASRELAKASFNLELRVGIVPLGKIREQGHQVLVGKYQPSEHFQQAMFQGHGLGYAEHLIKQDERGQNPYLIADDVDANGNFEGFECRWNEIPSSREETVAIMIQAIDQNADSAKKIYEQISSKIIDIYGNEESHHPVQLANLNLTLRPKELSNEVRVLFAISSKFQQLAYLLKLLLLVVAGKYLMARKVNSENADWGQYKQRVIVNTDYRKFDEVLRMVLSGTVKQREALDIFLADLYQQGQIVFGIHASPSAVVTCLVSDYNNDHVHFLDGSNGGYAMAAKQIKQRLSELSKELNKS